MKASIPAVPAGSGRLFVYMADGGPDILDTGGYTDGRGWMMDGHTYGLMGATFWYVDLPPGAHTLTSPDHLSVTFTLEQGETKYCRVDLLRSGLSVNATPLMVEPAVAEPQLADLDYYSMFDQRESNKRVARDQKHSAGAQRDEAAPDHKVDGAVDQMKTQK